MVSGDYGETCVQRAILAGFMRCSSPSRGYERGSLQLAAAPSFNSPLQIGELLFQFIEFATRPVTIRVDTFNERPETR